MKSLNSPTNPAISKRIRRHVLLALGAGFLAAYGLVLIAAVIAKEILK